MDVLEVRLAGDNAVTGIATGHEDFDNHTGGLQPGGLYLVAGRPKMGKTTFALGICQHAAIRQGKRVMMYHLEMTEKQVMDKVLAAEATIPLDAMKDGSALSDHSAQLMAAVSKMKDAHFDASYRSSYTMQQIRADARRKKRKDGLDLIMVDHLGLLNGDDPKHNQVAKITEISRQAKLMAKELNVPVLFLSQLNRSLEQRPNKRPVPSDLRDSGSLEQDADMIIFVYRDEVYHPDTDRKGIAEIIIGAARECSPETFFSIFQGKYSRFTKLDPAVFQGWDEEEPAPKSNGGTKWKKEGF
jgi:replicative DNA helicase